MEGNATDDMDDFIITEEYSNHETLGQLTIRKVGNVLVGFEDGQFQYEQANLAGAVYEIRAHGDIATGDRQGTLWYADGDLVATVTTGKEGQVDEVKFSPHPHPSHLRFPDRQPRRHHRRGHDHPAAGLLRHHRGTGPVWLCTYGPNLHRDFWLE